MEKVRLGKANYLLQLLPAEF